MSKTADRVLGVHGLVIGHSLLDQFRPTLTDYHCSSRLTRIPLAK